MEGHGGTVLVARRQRKIFFSYAPLCGTYIRYTTQTLLQLTAGSSVDNQSARLNEVWIYNRTCRRTLRYMFRPCYRQLDHFFTMTAVNQENHHYRYFQHIRGSNQRLWYSYHDELDSAKMH
jgi:hypothetical protein